MLFTTFIAASVSSLSEKKKKSPECSAVIFFLQDCLLGSARCVLFQCPLHSFSGQAVLKIHARLWNSSFIEVKKNKTTHCSHWSTASEWMITVAVHLQKEALKLRQPETVNTAVSFNHWVTCSCKFHIQQKISNRHSVCFVLEHPIMRSSDVSENYWNKTRS